MTRKRDDNSDPPRAADLVQQIDRSADGTEDYDLALHHTREAERLIDRSENKEKSAAEDAREAGQHLLAAKKAAGHGNWLRLLREHSKISEREAQRYMMIAESWESLLEDTGSDDPVDPRSSIRAVEDAIVRQRRVAVSARGELEKSIHLELHNLGDSEAIFLCSPAGQPIWYEQSHKHLRLMVEELNEKSKVPAKAWLADRRAQQEKEIEHANERWARQQRQQSQAGTSTEQVANAPERVAPRELRHQHLSDEVPPIENEEV